MGENLKASITDSCNSSPDSRSLLPLRIEGDANAGDGFAFGVGHGDGADPIAGSVQVLEDQRRDAGFQRQTSDRFLIWPPELLEV
jgi:hypothetical protein